jgi:predicted phage-related endonuclease
MLAEATTTEISKTTKPETFEENKQIARSGGEVAGIARKEAEKRTGKPVITSQNAVDFSQLISNVIEDSSDKDDKPE